MDKKLIKNDPDNSFEYHEKLAHISEEKALCILGIAEQKAHVLLNIAEDKSIKLINLSDEKAQRIVRLYNKEYKYMIIINVGFLLILMVMLGLALIFTINNNPFK